MVFKSVSIVLTALFLLLMSCIDPAPRYGLSYGAFVQQEGIQFRLLAPSSEMVYLVIFSKFDDNSGIEFPMAQTENGIWSYFLKDHGYGTLYGYRLKGEKNDSTIIVADPYSKSAVTQNTWRHVAKSLVIDTNFDWKGDSWKRINKKDLIIYEAHVSDMTKHPSSGSNYPGTYKGFVSDNQVGGIKHLKNLGVNAVQLLPIWDFANVEMPYLETIEGKTNSWNPYERNHWGYMPTFFMAPESYYASDGTSIPNKWNGIDGRAVTELKEMIRVLHKNEIAVFLDVVINHVSNYDYQPLKYIDRSLYFKLKEDGDFQSQCCGNLLDSDNQHVRNYIIESLKYWMVDYHIDGFRFDQANLLSSKTAKLILKELQGINPDVVVYGEAWDNKQTEFSRMSWGSFNDSFRDILRGDLHDFSNKGFLFGTYRPTDNINSLKTIIGGSLLSTGGLYVSSENSINFLEVHDNYSFSDYLRISLDKNHQNEIINDRLEHIRLTPEIKKLNTLGALILFTSQGIPIIHQGQEWAHSKIIAPTKVPDPDVGKMDPNSYNKDNETNWLNWEDAHQNELLVDYYIGLIALRKKYPELRRSTLDKIKFLNIKNELGLGYVIRDNITIFLNGNKSETLNVKLPPGKWLQVANGSKVDLRGFRISEGYVKIQATSGSVYIRV